MATAGLAFAGVHDSFWTHAGDVPRMNQLLREQFVALHSQPLLEQLLASFQVGGQHAVWEMPRCFCWEELLQQLVVPSTLPPEHPLQEQHPDVSFPPLPERGTLDLDLVKDSTYFFS